MPFLGIAYMAAVLERGNIPVQILDAWGLGLTFKEISSQIGRYRPDIIGITCTASAFGVSVELAKKIKVSFPDIKIVLGGPYVSAIPEEVLREIPWADFAVFGEGEYTMLELCQERPVEGIRGLAYRSSGRVIVNDDRPLIEDLDALPFPARHFYNMSRYRRPFYEFHGSPFAPIITSRGCPFHCRFCASHVVSGRDIRLRSIGNIVEEIDMLIRDYKVKFITIADDAPVFTMDRNRLADFCRAIKGKKFFWGAKARADSINEDNLSMMRDAGCRVLEVGCESGNPEVLKEWEKGISIGQIREAFRLMNKYGISSVAMFMLGAPEETKETILNTIRFAKELRAAYVIARILYPYPGTDAYNYLYEHKMIKPRGWEQIRNPEKSDPGISHPNLSTSELRLPGVSFKDLIILQRRMHREFYLDARYILSVLSKLKNWHAFKEYLKLFAGVVNFWRKWGLQ